MKENKLKDNLRIWKQFIYFAGKESNNMKDNSYEKQDLE